MLYLVVASSVYFDSDFELFARGVGPSLQLAHVAPLVEDVGAWRRCPRLFGPVQALGALSLRPQLSLCLERLTIETRGRGMGMCEERGREKEREGDERERVRCE